MSDLRMQDSFARCEENGNFGGQFYDFFLKTSPEVGELFANTDFNKQRKILRTTVFMLVKRGTKDPMAVEALELVGDTHSKANLDIRPELYEAWLDSLCDTVKKLDPQWSEELNDVWRSQIRPGIDIVTSLY